MGRSAATKAPGIVRKRMRDEVWNGSSIDDHRRPEPPERRLDAHAHVRVAAVASCSESIGRAG
jgi:hypothetical protein